MDGLEYLLNFVNNGCVLMKNKTKRGTINEFNGLIYWCKIKGKDLWLNPSKFQEYNQKEKQRKDDWYLKNKEIVKERTKTWSKNNKQKKSVRDAEYKKKRLSNDPLYKMSCSIRCLINISLRKFGYSKKSKTQEILGCSFLEFKRHIENQFKDGMGWHNKQLWHIDHITPVSSAKNESEILMLNNFKNLRPLWAKENISKGNKIPLEK